MYILGLTRSERILITKAKLRLFEENPKLKTLSHGKAILAILGLYVRGGKWKKAN